MSTRAHACRRPCKHTRLHARMHAHNDGICTGHASAEVVTVNAVKGCIGPCQLLDFRAKRAWTPNFGGRKADATVCVHKPQHVQAVLACDGPLHNSAPPTASLRPSFFQARPAAETPAARCNDPKLDVAVDSSGCHGVRRGGRRRFTGP